MIFATRWKRFADLVYVSGVLCGRLSLFYQLAIKSAFEALTIMDEFLLYQKKLAITWANMIDRCYNPDAQSYHWYGARGTGMCERWQHSVAAFIEDMGFPPTLKHSVDRIDCNGNYEPSNCRWATQEEQNNNTRRSKLITWNGKTQSVRDWAKEYNIGARALSERLRRGWDLEKSLKTPGRMGFAEELADRRERGGALWKEKGKLYSAHSKQKRGQRLSPAEQKAIETAEEEPLYTDAETFYMQREYVARQHLARQKILRQEFLEWA